MILTNLYTIGTASQEVVGPATQRQVVHLHNHIKSGNHYIHLGNETVSTTNSIHLDPSESMTMTLEPLDTLWAIASSANQQLGVLIVRQSQ
jgi:hypothetical protein